MSKNNPYTQLVSELMGAIENYEASTAREVKSISLVNSLESSFAGERRVVRFVSVSLGGAGSADKWKGDPKGRVEHGD